MKTSKYLSNLIYQLDCIVDCHLYINVSNEPKRKITIFTKFPPSSGEKGKN